MSIVHRDVPITIHNNIDVLVCDNPNCKSEYHHEDGGLIHYAPVGWFNLNYHAPDNNSNPAVSTGRDHYDFCTLTCLKVFVLNYEPIQALSTNMPV